MYVFVPMAHEFIYPASKEVKCIENKCKHECMINDLFLVNVITMSIYRNFFHCMLALKWTMDEYW